MTAPAIGAPTGRTNPTRTRPCAACGHAKRYHAAKFRSLAGLSPCLYPYNPVGMRRDVAEALPDLDECFEYVVRLATP